MAIVEMSRLRLIGLKSDKNKIMGVLTRSRRFELLRSEALEGTVREQEGSHLERITGKQVRVAFAIHYLYGADDEMKKLILKNAQEAKAGIAEPFDFSYTPLPKPSNNRSIIGYEDLYDCSAKEYELLSVADALEKISFRKVDVRTEEQKLKNRMRAVEPFRHYPLPFSVRGTGRTVVLPAYASAKSAVFDCEGVYAEEYPSSGKCIAVIADKRDEPRVRAALAAGGFTVASMTDDQTAAEIASACAARLAALKAETLSLVQQSLNYLKYLRDMKILYDYLSLEIEKAKAEFDLGKTAATFMIEGWVPKSEAEYLLSEVRSKTDKVVTYLYEPQPGENPPTEICSPKLIRPFEDVTNLYSPPSYYERDPNPIMSIFFFVFFGFMVADAGYGLIITIAASVILRLKRFEKGMHRLIALIGICGVSTIVWGAVMGGVFGIEGIPALWFNPLEQPITMLAVAIVMGIIQLLVGYGLYAAKMIRKKDYASAIFDVLFVYTIFIGVGLMVLGMLILKNKIVQNVGLYVLLGSLVGIVLTAGHAQKGILKKLLFGFSGLYGLVNLLSDVLSYIRLFGLGLASGAIALAFNSLGGLLFGIPFVGYPLGILILIPLHAFNLALSLLSAYVHNARLQFIEFYGKFYDGGGRLFSPMGMKTKYVRFA